MLCSAMKCYEVLCYAVLCICSSMKCFAGASARACWPKPEPKGLSIIWRPPPPPLPTLSCPAIILIIIVTVVIVFTIIVTIIISSSILLNHHRVRWWRWFLQAAANCRASATQGIMGNVRPRAITYPPPPPSLALCLLQFAMIMIMIMMRMMLIWFKWGAALAKVLRCKLEGMMAMTRREPSLQINIAIQSFNIAIQCIAISLQIQKIQYTIYTYPNTRQCTITMTMTQGIFLVRHKRPDKH